MNRFLASSLCFFFLLALFDSSIHAIVISELNILKGNGTTGTAILAPSNQFRTGIDGLQDQYVGVTSASMVGGGNQIAQSVFSIPGINGYWNSVQRFLPYTGHISNTFPLTGYEMGVEGSYLNGIEMVDRWYLWSFQDQRTLLSRDMQNPDSLIIGQNNKPLLIWSPGAIQSESWIHGGNGFSTKDQGVWINGITKTGICARFVNGLCVE